MARSVRPRTFICNVLDLATPAWLMQQSWPRLTPVGGQPQGDQCQSNPQLGSYTHALLLRGLTNRRCPAGQSPCAGCSVARVSWLMAGCFGTPSRPGNSNNATAPQGAVLFCAGSGKHQMLNGDCGTCARCPVPRFPPDPAASQGVWSARKGGPGQESIAESRESRAAVKAPGRKRPTISRRQQFRMSSRMS